MEPAHAGEEQHRGERRAVDERGAEVGLEEDEGQRHETEAEGGQDRAEPRDPAAALDEEAGDREHEERLAELGGLELERPDVDPPLRAAHGLREHEDEQHEPDGGAVQRPPVALVDGGRDEDRDHHAGEADAGGDRLPGHVVVGVAGDVEAGDPADRPQPVGHERARGEEQQPVEPAHDRPDVEEADGRRAKRRGPVTGLDDQSTFTRGWMAAVLWKYCSKTRRAAGAAAEEPWPPFSITAQTTSWASSEGP